MSHRRLQSSLARYQPRVNWTDQEFREMAAKAARNGWVLIPIQELTNPIEIQIVKQISERFHGKS